MTMGWLRRPRRALLRTRVLVGVVLVTLAALAAFDVAAVTALRTYLIGQSDSQLSEVLGLYRLVNIQLFQQSVGRGAAGAALRSKEFQKNRMCFRACRRSVRGLVRGLSSGWY